MDIVIYPPGGVGYSELFKIIKKYNNNIKINDINDVDKLKHKPINNITKRALYIMNDPLLAILSHYRRNWSKIQMRKLNNYKYNNLSLENLFSETEKKNRDILELKVNLTIIYIQI